MYDSYLLSSPGCARRRKTANIVRKAASIIWQSKKGFGESWVPSILFYKATKPRFAISDIAIINN